MVTGSTSRIQLAAGWARACTRQGNEMIILSGSAGAGNADDHSDVDLYVFVDALAASTSNEDSLLQLGLRKTFALPTKRGGLLERYIFQDMAVDIELVPRAVLTRTLDAVLIKGDVDPEKQKVIRGLLDAVALYGQEEWELWCRKLEPYPRQLAINMVRAHMHFEQLVRLKRRTLERDDPLAFCSRLVVAMVNIVGTLAGLNAYYWGADPAILKWTDVHLSRMQRRPPETGQRIKAGLRDPSDSNLRDLENLVNEVLDLVEVTFPEVPTCYIRPFLCPTETQRIAG